MIMRPGQQLLLPANPVLHLGQPAAGPAGQHAAARAALPWMPDFLAVVLVFWSVHQPLRVGIGAAFVFGLCMDVHQAALLGQHALAYTALSFFAITIHRRLLWFTVPSQAVQVLPLFVAGACHRAGDPDARRRRVSRASTVLLAPLLEARAVAGGQRRLLLAPQRRAPDPDANRPLNDRAAHDRTAQRRSRPVALSRAGAGGRASSVLRVPSCCWPSRLVYLQVARHEDLSEQAESNRTAIVPIVPNRGLILDRNGIVLATNYSAYTLEITPSRVEASLDKTIDDAGAS